MANAWSSQVSPLTRPLKAAILAAGQGADARSGADRALEQLGDRAVIDYVMDLARQFCPPEEIYVVVGQQRGALQKHLGTDVNYVVQREPLGTGHAVLVMRRVLHHYEGDLLILYGDTPLFRPASIRGLVLRHQLTGADLTLFTAQTEQALPYGRIVREDEARIADVVEEADASVDQRRISELNLGAYVARARPLLQALQQVTQDTHARQYHLTDAVGQMVREGRRVEAYQSGDQDEIRGINTADDLEAAELVLQRRLLRPGRIEEESVIQFGTGGWRAIIGESFTMQNVRRLAQTLANTLIREGRDRKGVLIGYDHRFLSDAAAETAAEVFAGNNIPVALLTEPAPTPLITYATAGKGAAYGLAFTASHNPPEWNGLKVFQADGALLLDDQVRAIEGEANALSRRLVVTLELPLAEAAGIVARCDYTNQYVDAVEAQVDMEAMREAGLRIAVDPMYGVGEVTLDIVLTEARCRVGVIHGRRDPLFGGRSPAPDMEALGLLMHTVREGAYHLGIATDGDADRIAVVDEAGRYVSVNDLLLLLYWYLHEIRGLSGGVVRNLSTTHMLDRLAKQFGEVCIEVPVGFKHIIVGMQEHGAVLGGESSGGLTIRGHILGKDGILAAALIAEMLAKTGRPISELLEDVRTQVGPLYMEELSLPATPEMRVQLPRRLSSAAFDELAGCRVLDISNLDGTKLLLEGDQWVLLRFSGTEPLLRIVAESDSPAKAEALIVALRERLGF
ncbi:MAG: NTP transferase domain-containing protein [Anaerolineae bacterium]|jgi:phosphomannomutase/molybdopterin-guanine dinucleotide biosynthesis protein A